MTAISKHVKLGLLAISTVAALVVAAVALGVHVVSEPTVIFHTYFDETVQGLDKGAPVKYRGVTIGTVKWIAVAPDRQRVDVALAVLARDARMLRPPRLPAGLRAQLSTQGITGVKFVDLDLFDPATNPPPVLSFQPPANYIPARPSLLKGVSESLSAVSQRLPEVADQMSAVLHRIDDLLADIGTRRIPARLEKAIDGFDATMSDLRRVARQLRDARIDALVASARRAGDALHDFGHEGAEQIRDLGEAIHDIDEAARSIRNFVQMVEREPDVLVKGRARRKDR